MQSDNGSTVYSNYMGVLYCVQRLNGSTMYSNYVGVLYYAK